MFDLDVGKMMVFGIVALAVIPPKDLPRVLRTVGKYVGQMRRMATEFQGQFMDALKEADVESVQKEIESIGSAARIDTSFDAGMAMRPEIAKSAEGEHAPSGSPPLTTEIRVDEPFAKEVVVAPLAAETEPLTLPAAEQTPEQKTAASAGASPAQ